MNNNVSRLIGGPGGWGANDGAGGTGGIAAGFYLNASSGNIVKSNTITSLTAGTKGRAAGYVPGYQGNWGVEGHTTGIWLESAENNTLTPLITQGNYKIPDSANINTIEGYPILYIYTQIRVNISDYDIASSTAPVTIDGSIRTGNRHGKGGNGGISLGIGLINVNDSIINNVSVSGFSGMPGGGGAYQAAGGDGGLVIGIYLKDSNNITLSNGVISSLISGAGGNAEEGKWGYGGDSGNATGIFFHNSNNNIVYRYVIYGLMNGSVGIGRWDGLNNGSHGSPYSIYLNISNSNTFYDNLFNNTVNFYIPPG